MRHELDRPQSEAPLEECGFLALGETHGEILFCKRTDIHRAEDAGIAGGAVGLAAGFRPQRGKQPTAPGDEAAAVPDPVRTEVYKRGEADQVGEASRRNSAAVVKSEALGGMQRGHAQGPQRICAELDRTAQRGVNVAVPEQIAGVAVVADQQAAAVPGRLEKLDEGGEVGRRRALADHDPLAEREFLSRLRHIRRLMVGQAARRHIGLQIASRETGPVSVNMRGVGELGQQVVISCEQRRMVHHLGEADDPLPLIIGTQTAGIEHRPGVVKRRGRHA